MIWSWRLPNLRRDQPAEEIKVKLIAHVCAAASSGSDVLPCNPSRFCSDALDKVRHDRPVFRFQGGLQCYGGAHISGVGVPFVHQKKKIVGQSELNMI